MTVNALHVVFASECEETDKTIQSKHNCIRLQVLGTPTREQIREMNPNYTEFKFPQIKSHPWAKVSQCFTYSTT